MSARDRVTPPKTELRVSRLCLGGNRFGGALDEAQSFALLDAFVAAGGNFIDTAHIYADWIPGAGTSSSEKTLGRWLASRRPTDVVIATKGAHPGLAPGAPPRLDPASLRQDVGECRAHLGLPTLDLFYVHRDDPARPVADILGSLEALRSEGAIRHYGASNWTAARLIEAERICAAQGWQGFVAHQPEWNLAARNAGAVADDLYAMDADMLALHARTQMTAMPYSAQAKGYFDKAPAGAARDPAMLNYDNAVNRARGARLAAIGARHGATPTQVMLAAMMRAPFLTIPVVGCRTPDQVTSSLRSLDIALDAAEAAELLGWVGLAPARS